MAHSYSYLSAMRLSLVLVFVVAAASLATAKFHSHTESAGPDRFASVVSDTPEDQQVAAVYGLLGRLGLSSSIVKAFDLSLGQQDPSGNDVFVISTPKKGAVKISGSSGVALSSGVYWYLKYYCNSDVSWGEFGTGDQISVSLPLPTVASPIRIVSPVKYRYYMNVCTMSYSAVFWDWARWEREIDWMALQGYNLPLAFTGQEYVWEQVFLKLGLNQTMIDEWFTGPSFLAWNRMGNIRGWGGPMTQNWRKGQYELQLKILARERSFGMSPVLPAFAGHVPTGFTEVFPNANYSVSTWGYFSPQYNNVMTLAPSQTNANLYMTVQQLFLKSMIATYGSDHLYNADTWNEMDPPSNDPSYLNASSSLVFDSMLQADPDARWVMQGWCFIVSSFWGQAQAQAYLDAVPTPNLLILDLSAESSPGYLQFQNWFNKSFIWCLLHNFGGRRSLYGDLVSFSSAPYQGLAVAPNMIGTGITMEAIDQNPVVYNLFSEVAWHSEALNMTTWIPQYATRRYGANSPNALLAWEQLFDCCYGPQWFAEGMFELAPHPGMTVGTAQNATGVLAALKFLLAAAAKKEVNARVGPFRYDLVDVGRQFLADAFYDIYRLFDHYFLVWFDDGYVDLNNVQTIATGMLNLITDLDTLLASDPNFLLGVWTNRAVNQAVVPSEVPLLLFNAKNQITLWGPNGEINDYAEKHWAGLVGEYHYGRWSRYLTAAINAMNGGSWDRNGVDSAIIAFGQQWCNSSKQYSNQTKGDSIAIATSIVQKYATLSGDYQELANSDSEGGNDIVMWTADPGVLEFLCNLDANCLGFNSNGSLKYPPLQVGSSDGITLWIKPSSQ